MTDTLTVPVIIAADAPVLDISIPAGVGALQRILEGMEAAGKREYPAPRLALGGSSGHDPHEDDREALKSLIDDCWSAVAAYRMASEAYDQPSLHDSE